jgi:hypothetical protein
MARQLTVSDGTDQRMLTECANVAIDDISETPAILLTRAQAYAADIAAKHFLGFPIEMID